MEYNKAIQNAIELTITIQNPDGLHHRIEYNFNIQKYALPTAKVLKSKEEICFIDIY